MSTRYFKNGCGRRHGFTMLEIVIALMIVSVIFLGTAPLVLSSLREKRMRGWMDEIAFFAIDERAAAERSGVEQRVFLSKDGFEKVDPESDHPEVAVGKPAQGELTVRFPGQQKWSKLDGQVWRFFPAGMVTPLSIRLEEGADWIETDFDFLTGRVADQRYAF